jgi:hypothetical protein
VLAALGDTVMVCSQRGDEASVRIRSLRSGDTVAEQPAPRCPDSAIGTSNAVTAAAGGSVFDWNGELLSNHEVQGVLSATTPVGWSRERLALVERFDGTCASSRRVLLRSGDFGEETIWRGECDGDERLIPVSFTTTRGDGAAVVRPAGDGVFVEIFHRNGQRAGRLTLDNLPSATARLAGDGENLRIVDPAASASERVDVGTSGTATFVREGPVLWVERDGLPIGSLVVLGEEAVVTAPGSIVATDGVAGRVALPTDGAEQLLRGLAAATQR